LRNRPCSDAPDSPENGADRQRQQRARQADFAHDHLRHFAAAAEQRFAYRKRRQPHRPDAERDQRQQYNEGGKRRGRADPPARGILVGHGNSLNTHRSS
jgi:hypothetical protein